MTSRDGRRTLRFGLGVVLLVTLLIHLPALRWGRLLDDLVLLERARSLPWSSLLTEGFRIRTVDFGNPWWIPRDDLAHYFRPLLLASLRIPQYLPRGSDFVQHALNIAIHLGATCLVYATARTLLLSRKATLLATALFATCTHHWITVQWLMTRKELLAGAFLVAAFLAHLRRRPGSAGALFALAFLSGEHAAVFPAMAVLWDLVGREKGDEKTPKGRSSLPWRSWLIYALILGILMALRHGALGGFPTPIAPYFWHPSRVGFAAYALLKTGVWLCCLVLVLPYYGFLPLQAAVDHPVFAAVFLAATLAALVWLGTVARQRRAFLALLGIAVVSHLPFLAIAPAPHYMYSTVAFYALAVGVAVAGAEGNKEKSRLARHLPKVVAGVCAIQIVVVTAIAFMPIREVMSAPQKVSAQLTTLLAGQPKDRLVLLVDVPGFCAFAHVGRLTAAATGRSVEDFVPITARSQPTERRMARLSVFGAPRRGARTVTRRNAHCLRVENREWPWFDTPLERLATFLEPGLVKVGKVFRRPGYQVIITSLGPPPSERGHRFLSKEPGVTGLEVRVDPSFPAPIVVIFDGPKGKILGP